MGYAPLFDSITRGTLYGRWPDIGLWPILLAIADKNGIIDCTHEYISGVTGLAAPEVTACMRRFCAPDPGSRSRECDGARLVLLDDRRDWGWRIVNHTFYREKARKASYDAERTSSGADAERKRLTRDVPTPPANSRAGPLSDSDANSDTHKSARASESPSRKASRKVPANFEVPAELRAKLKAELPADFDADAETLKFRTHEFKNPRSDWEAVWANWMRTARDRGDYAKAKGARWV